MDPLNLLDELLGLLNLDIGKEKLVRGVFQHIRTFIPSFSDPSLNRKISQIPSSRDIENSARKLRKVINHLNSVDEQRDDFLDIFPEWEVKRNRNIKKLIEIAQALKKSRENCSVLQILGGGVGLLGGAAIIGSILFPPAAAAILPSFFLPAVAATGGALSAGGALATGAGAVTQLATSVKEAVVKAGHLQEAKDTCQQDKKSFDQMMKWFQHTRQLDEALEDLFGTDILEVIFKDLEDHFGSFNLGREACMMALSSCVKKIFGRKMITCTPLHAAVVAVFLVVFLVRRRNRFLLQCVIMTHRLGFGLMAALNAKPLVGRLIAKSVVKEADLIPAVASKVAVGALAGIGMALDLANIVLNSVDLAEGSESEEQKKILEVSEELQKELESIRGVYNELSIAAKKAAKEFMNSFLKRIEMTEECGDTVHEIHWEVMSESRILRKSKRAIAVADLSNVDHQKNSDNLEIDHSNIREIKEVFDDGNKENEKFVNVFPQWESKRKENVRHLRETAFSIREFKDLLWYAQLACIIAGIIVICPWPSWNPEFASKLFLALAVVVLTAFALATNIMKGARRIQLARKLFAQDNSDFLLMQDWFRSMHKLYTAFKNLFGEGVIDAALPELSVLVDRVVNYQFSWHEPTLKDCIRKIISHPCYCPSLGPADQKATLAVVLSLVCNSRRNKFVFKSHNTYPRFYKQISYFGSEFFNKYYDKYQKREFIRCDLKAKLPRLEKLEMRLLGRQGEISDTICSALTFWHMVWSDTYVSNFANDLEKEIEDLKMIYNQLEKNK